MKKEPRNIFFLHWQPNVDSSMMLTILICKDFWGLISNNYSGFLAHWCRITQRAKSCWVPNNRIPFSQEHYLNSCATTSVSLSIKQMGWHGAAGILKAVKHCWWLFQEQTQDIRTAIFHPAPGALQAHASSQQWDPAESTVPHIKDLHWNQENMATHKMYFFYMSKVHKCISRYLMHTSTWLIHQRLPVSGTQQLFPGMQGPTYLKGWDLPGPHLSGSHAYQSVFSHSSHCL